MTSAGEPGSQTTNTATGTNLDRVVQAQSIHGDIYLVNGDNHPLPKKPPKRLSSKQRLIVVGAVVAVCGSIAYGAWHFFGAEPPAPPVLRSGHHELTPEQGLDMDTGEVTDQNVQGVDISPGGEAVVINAMTHGTPKLATLPDPGPIDGRAYAACSAVAPGLWDKTIYDLYQMRVGERVCVITTGGNLGVVRLTQVPSKVLPRLDFDYTTWQGR
ncbi:hypothetical protein ABZX92_30550 [Lentzea sp. NPDC006480]|uniref:hypothetical protein n=1 Tax=Lentzea sp. NPDC006480 TaxID=3157176 RepID=UPI0033BD187D